MKSGCWNFIFKDFELLALIPLQELSPLFIHIPVVASYSSQVKVGSPASAA